MRSRRRHRSHAASLLVAAAGALAACGSSGGSPAEPVVVPTASSPAMAPASSPVLERLLALPDVSGTDTVAVWICEVPLGTTDPTYVESSMRLDLDPDGVVERLGARLSRYFRTVSHGRYDVALVAGGTIEMAAGDDGHDCVDRAVDAQAASARADVVLAVATAEHVATAPGGWGSAGGWPGCVPDCSLERSRRAAYVGASDFHPDWGAVPALDLVEHELGHTLGLPHSGAAGDVDGGYSSALDLMSDSAAPRDVDPGTLDGPDLIAIDRVALGWIPATDVVVVPRAPTVVRMRPSTSADGPRIALLPLDDHRALTVEWLEPTGFHAHLPEPGAAIHLVDDSTGGTTTRTQTTVGSPPPSTDLLVPGESIDVDGWRVRVSSSDDGWAELSIVPIDR